MTTNRRLSRTLRVTGKGLGVAWGAYLRRTAVPQVGPLASVAAHAGPLPDEQTEGGQAPPVLLHPCCSQTWRMASSSVVSLTN